MPGTILEYLKNYGDVPLTEMPFRDVDALILCELCYLKFDGLLPGPAKDEPPVRLRELPERRGFEGLFADEKYEKPNRVLFERVTGGRRFGELRADGYLNLVEKELEMQFSAITFHLPDGSVFLAYRGTDETLVGWKEDFNMSFLDEVPAQRHALSYLERMGAKLSGTFRTGGHSKGGNLAIYASMNAPEELRERIFEVYCFDGPGFRREILEKGHYGEIRSRIRKLIPQSSIVGMLQEREHSYRIVRSFGYGPLQHNPYTWAVDGTDFVYETELKGSARVVDGALNDWLESLDEGRRRRFFDCLYEILDAADADDRNAFAAEPLRNANKVLAAMRDLDEESAQMLREVSQRFFAIMMTYDDASRGPLWEGARRFFGKRARETGGASVPEQGPGEETGKEHGKNR